MKESTRRDFIKKLMITASIIPFAGLPGTSWALNKESNNKELAVHIFSKHLQFLDCKSMGERVVEMGFSGIDLTVRPKGHVLPENVKSDLPKAIHDIEKAGSRCQLITTAVENVNNPLDVDVLRAAASLGVQFYRPGWFRYPENGSMEAAIEQYKVQVKALSELNKSLGIVGCYQNHSGKFVGASMWEVKQILADVLPDFFGAQYDIRHNMVEGANSWENSLRLIHNSIKTIVVKDYKWAQVNGKWMPVNTPIGEGMVDFKTYFRLLKKYQINVPVSLHIEYPLGGAEKGKSELTVDEKVVFDAMKKDLIRLQELWKEA
ncbi:sugar phosphate isomerase/epimerase family protein [Labilibaculum sp.]|uniref:sugar phosphate isomerase/epimerase family protein n=1 Tax=Labilibaculum sp. TaxID=2060723 RepID=UPI0035621F32